LGIDIEQIAAPALVVELGGHDEDAAAAGNGGLELGEGGGEEAGRRGAEEKGEEDGEQERGVGKQRDDQRV